MSPELKAKLESQAEKHEIRGQSFKELIIWVEDGMTRSGIIENLERGFFEVASMKDGEPSFSLTPAGKKYIQSML